MTKRSVRFSTQVLLLQIGVLVLVCATGLGLMALLLRNNLISENKQRAVSIARSVAADERNAAALATGDGLQDIQARAEAVRRRTGALFVVVTDRGGIRFSHPNVALIGRRVDGRQAQALTGREITTFGSSAAGPSARGKVPVRDASGAIVGQVIVAISARGIDARLSDLVQRAAGFLGIALAIGATGAFGLTRRHKRQTVGLEPADLRLLLDQQAALRRVATLVARAAPPDEVFAAVTEEAAQLLGADAMSLIRYVPDGTATVVASWDAGGSPAPIGSTFAVGPPGDGTCEAPIFVAGRLWGLMVAASSLEHPLPPDTEARLAEFTDLAATAIANAESRGELSASRARVVAAADESRRRIERDLHDGAQQRLISLSLELRSTQNAVPAEMDELKAELSRAAAGLTEVVDDLQELSRGIHPAILSKGGLVPALKALARRSAVPVELHVRADGRLPERAEVAGYYVVSEALTNAAKYAEASAVHVELDVEDAMVRLAIRDDGVGGADPSRGSGLTGLRDRVEAIGGTITIASPAGGGTSLLIGIPLAPD
jgi:signal transduction histidine kinase